MPIRLYRFTQSCLLLLLVSVIGRTQTLPLHPAPDKLDIAQETEREALAKKDTLALAEAYYMYGKGYITIGNHLIAHQYFTKSLRILEKHGDSYQLGRVYIRLSDVEYEQEHWKESIQYGRIGLAIFKRINSEKGLLLAYGAISRGYGKIWAIAHANDLKHPFRDSLWRYYRRTEQIAREMRDTLALIEAVVLIGELYLIENKYEGLAYFQKGLNYYIRKGKPFSQVAVLQAIAKNHLHFGETVKAFEAIKRADSTYKKMPKHYNHDENFLELYIQYYQATHNWQQAFIYSEKLRELDKKILTADRAGAISRLNIEYETQKKEAQLKSQQQEITLRAENERNQQIFLLITFALLLVAMGATVAFYRLYRKNQRISQQNEELVKEQNHRVKNNLQVVSSLLNLQARQLPDSAAKRAVTDSQLRIQSMAILHRRLYDGEELAKVNLPEFIQELVQGVLKTFGYQSIIPAFGIETVHLHADKAVPLGLIINELVTNACKYAFPCTDVPTLEISCRQKDNKLQLTVADNGPGWNESLERGVVVSKKSFGMKLIKSQAE